VIRFCRGRLSTIFRFVFSIRNRRIIMLHGFIKKNTENTNRGQGAGLEKKK